MKLGDVIFLSIAAALIIIGIHQTMVAGIGNAYWIIMLASVFFMIFLIRKKR